MSADAPRIMTLHSSIAKAAAWMTLLVAPVGCATREYSGSKEDALPKVTGSQEGDAACLKATLPPVPIGEDFPLSEELIAVASGKWDAVFPNMDDVTLGAPSKKVDMLLREPPTEIPGAESVEHAISPTDPAMRLIVIRDFHGTRMTNLLSEHLREQEPQDACIRPNERTLIEMKYAEHRREVKLIQEQIKLAISYLSTEWGIREVYKEGSTVQSVEGHMELLRDLSGADGASLLKSAQHKLMEVWEQHDTACHVFLRKELPYSEYVAALQEALKVQQIVGDSLDLNAVDQLYMKGEIDVIVPAEIDRLLDAGQKLFGRIEERKSLLEAIEVNSQLRESAFLGIASALERKGDGVICLVMGGAHDFVDNVEAYNLANPKRQMALTVVTPKLFQKKFESALKQTTY